MPLNYRLLLVTVVGVVALVLIRARRTRSIAGTCFGQVVWQVTALPMVRGFLVTPRDSMELIEYRLIA